MASIDLNADVGEGVPGDDALLAVVTSANVACGFHAGNEATMRATCEHAVANGVRIGAHIGYRDREGFGRRELGTAPDVLAEEAGEQLAALAAHVEAAGGTVRYVKPHGALYHRCTADPDAAAAIARAVRAFGPSLAVVGFPGGAGVAAAAVEGLVAVAEGFADRGYGPDGRLLPRGELGAVLDPPAAAEQAVRLARAGELRTLCVHGDSPDAPAVAGAVRAALEAAGIGLAPFA